MTFQPPGPKRSVGWAWVAGLMACGVVVAPIVIMLFVAWIEWTGCLVKCSSFEPQPNRPKSILLLVLSGMLVVDIGLWSWAGLRCFPVVRTIVAAVPLVIMVVVVVIGVYLGEV